MPSPFVGALPRGYRQGASAEPPKSRLQPPLVNRRVASSRPRPSRPTPEWRTIHLDIPGFEPRSLDSEFWSTDSPLAPKGSATFKLPRVPTSGHLVRCSGRPEGMLVLWASLGAPERRVAEQPFYLKTGKTRGKLDFLTDNEVERADGSPTPWSEVTAWEVKAASALRLETRSASRARDDLEKQVDRGLKLAGLTGCGFRLAVVERRGWPTAPDPAAISQQYGCDVLVITRVMAENLVTLFRYRVLLEGRNEELTDRLLDVLRNEVSMTAPELAAQLGAPVGTVIVHVCHALQQGLMTTNLKEPLSGERAYLSLHDECWSNLARLRGNPYR